MPNVIYGDTPYFDAYMPGNVTMAQLGATVPFSAVANGANAGGAFNTSTYTFTPRVAGWYQFNLYLNWESSTVLVGRMFPTVYHYITGGTYGYRLWDVSTSSTNVVSNSGTCTLYFNGTTDSVNIQAYMAASGGSAILNGGTYGLAAHCRWQGHLVRGA